MRLHFERAGAPHLPDLDLTTTTFIKRAIRTLGLDEACGRPARSSVYNARRRKGASRTLEARRSVSRRDDRITALQRCASAGSRRLAELRCGLGAFRDHRLSDHYRRRFRHVLVDEFQDTNALQYTWLKQLVGDSGTLFAVGDDDQSIYSWRGARVEHMLRFQRDFAGSRLLRLTQNYRSTATILKAANALIANNAKARPGAGPEGPRPPIGLFPLNELRRPVTASRP